ncbi:hypothetical protein V1264_013219 [Littorina saxatilis]|uniref:Uncharacterized protein n=1 Tax=Littorina saxatilis TaxID=31220 RepID=A0AAN9BPZ7_9CAEN
MEVTNGLISRLVKSKSTERVLAPIASQVSLLMILNEVQGEEPADASALNVSACVDRVTQAVEGFIRVGHDQRHRSPDPLFDSQMSAACETLELAKSELYVAGQRISGTPTSSRAHSSLTAAAKDVLQAVLRVLVVVDDVEVRRCVQAVSVVETKVKNVCNVRESRDLVSAFKELTEAVLYMTMMMSRRQKDLVSSAQRDELMTGLNLMRKGVSSLRMAIQTHLKYPNNPQAQACKQQVLDQTISVLMDMRATLESGPPTDLDADLAGHFVDHIDKVLEGLGEGSRFELSPDMESWIASIIRHAMGVALLCHGTYRHLVTRTCQRILQSKFRLFELQQSMIHSPHLSEIRLDYEGVCEVLLDEFCELEKHVNMALLNLIIDTCCFTSQPLEQLATAAIHNQVRRAQLPSR